MSDNTETNDVSGKCDIQLCKKYGVSLNKKFSE